MKQANIRDGLHLKAARALAGPTQAELAARIGVHVRSVVYWERQRGRVPTTTPSTMERIEQALLEAGVAVSTDPVPGVSLCR